MHLRPLLAGLLTAVPMVALAQPVPQSSYKTGQGVPTGGDDKIPAGMQMWCDDTSPILAQLCTPRVASRAYPMPVQSPKVVHTTLPNAVLTTGVAQVIVPAGSIATGCDITFTNAYGDFYLAFTDPGAPSVPTAAAPAGVTVGTTGRGLHLQMGGGFATSVGFVYHCPGPTAQGISVLYVANPGANPPASTSTFIQMDVY